jgi:hypothetical protein
MLDPMLGKDIFDFDDLNLATDGALSRRLGTSCNQVSRQETAEVFFGRRSADKTT